MTVKLLLCLSVLSLSIPAIYAGYAMTIYYYASNNCSGTAHAVEFDREGVCLTGTDGYPTIINHVNSNEFAIMTFPSNDISCNDYNNSDYTVRGSQCRNNGEGESLNNYQYSDLPYLSFNYAYMSTLYISCTNRTILSRFFYIPNVCIPTGTTSVMYLPCTVSSLPYRTYNTTNCTGTYTSDTTPLTSTCTTNDNGYGEELDACFILNDQSSTATTATSGSTASGTTTSGATASGTTASGATASGATASGTTGSTTGPGTVSLTISLDVTVDNGTVINTTAIASGFASSLSLDLSAVSVEAKRQVGYTVKVTVIYPLNNKPASEAQAELNTRVGTALDSSTSPISKVLSNEGATVNSYSVTVSPASSTTVGAASTTGSSGSKLAYGIVSCIAFVGLSLLL